MLQFWGHTLRDGQVSAKAALLKIVFLRHRLSENESLVHLAAVAAFVLLEGTAEGFLCLSWQVACLQDSREAAHLEGPFAGSNHGLHQSRHARFLFQHLDHVFFFVSAWAHILAGAVKDLVVDRPLDETLILAKGATA